MICASVPLREVIAHIDGTLGDAGDAPVSIRRPPFWLVDETDDGDPTEVVFLLTSFRRAA